MIARIPREQRARHADDPVLTVGDAARLSGMHPQTLRQYDRLGLVTPRRARGMGRRYSLRDVATLRVVQRLSHEEGINLAGIRRILELEARVAALEARVELLASEPGSRVFAAGSAGDVELQRRRMRRAGRAESAPRQEGSRLRRRVGPPLAIEGRTVALRVIEAAPINAERPSA